MLPLFQFQAAPINISFSSHQISNKPLSSTLYSISCDSNPSLLKFCLAGKPRCAASEIENNEQNEIELPGGLDPELMPKHVAIIMDGNRRWARNRGLTPQEGHKAGGEALKLITSTSRKYGVKVLSVFAFSTENWIRPKEEVDFLMEMFEETIKTDFEELMQNDVRVTFLGDRSQFPQSLQNVMLSAEERAKDKKGPRFVVAANYSGRYDITQATREIAREVKDGVLQVEDIDENLLEQHLETNGLEFPKPDLLIRSSGELRVSNYMLWQSAYTQLYFSTKMFPDINEEDFVEALAEFQRRRRRFGGGGH